MERGRLLAARYRLVDPIGSGAHGDVWAAEDRVTGETVALKWLRHAARAAAPRARGELVAMRRLRFPGVVRVLDEGMEDGRLFFVMDPAPGAPFPGPRGLAEAPSGTPRLSTWPEIEGPTLALLEILSHVHAAGVVHRDLKPGNVLVDALGRPTVLDFGIAAWGWGRDPDLQRGGGTPAYLAPEQILAQGADLRSDLYSIGAMLYEALGGSVPHASEDAVHMLRTRLRFPASPLRERAPRVPLHVATAVDRLLSLRLEDRYRSAHEVVDVLRGADARAGDAVQLALSAAVSGSFRDAAPRARRRALRALFSGTDRLFHTREDGAALLWELSAGDPSRLEEELRRWLRLGLARQNGGRIALDPDLRGRSGALVRGTSQGQERLLRLFEEGDMRGACREAIGFARRQSRSGALDRAGAALLDALATARIQCVASGTSSARATSADVEEQILGEYVKVSFALGTPKDLSRALYELSRAVEKSAAVARLDRLLRAGLAVQEASARAMKLSGGLRPFSDPELEWRRVRTHARAAAAVGAAPALARSLRRAEAWAALTGSRWAHLSAAEVRARLRYMQGRFEQAASAHMEAARWEPSRTGRIMATVNSASALLEAFQSGPAAERAGSAKRLAARSRDAHAEGRAEWILRAAHYRSGEASSPDLELVEAVTLLGAEGLEALVCLTEAAIAFRAREDEIAATLSGRAHGLWKRMGRDDSALLAECLGIAADRCAPRAGAEPPGSVLDALIDRAVGCKIVGVGIQALGLIGLAWPASRPSWRLVEGPLAAQVPKRCWHLRMDVLSVDECLRGELTTPPARLTAEPERRARRTK